MWIDIGFFYQWKSWYKSVIISGITSLLLKNISCSFYQWFYPSEKISVIDYRWDLFQNILSVIPKLLKIFFNIISITFYQWSHYSKKYQWSLLSVNFKFSKYISFRLSVVPFFRNLSVVYISAVIKKLPTDKKKTYGHPTHTGYSCSHAYGLFMPPRIRVIHAPQHTGYLCPK